MPFMLAENSRDSNAFDTGAAEQIANVQLSPLMKQAKFETIYLMDVLVVEPADAMNGRAKNC